MYNPSAEELGCGLIDSAMNAVDSDLNGDTCTFDRVNATLDIVDVDTISTLFEERFVSSPAKVKIKLIQIMRDHDI